MHDPHPPAGHVGRPVDKLHAPCRERFEGFVHIVDFKRYHHLIPAAGRQLLVCVPGDRRHEVGRKYRQPLDAFGHLETAVTAFDIESRLQTEFFGIKPEALFIVPDQ